MLLAAMLTLFASIGSPLALSGLAAFVALALPFLDIRAVSALGTAALTPWRIVASSALLAAFATPVGLWIVAAFSRDSVIFRGRRTWGFWLGSAFLAAAAEALLPLLGRAL